ncbi:zinc-binding alcohol dehydrogenase family protein [Pelobium manganitolerans]|uniref:zinc-binding alcohol dehydrogenase family protein n=1 Tax=Pelobium manganitolerans TaxID=1842495 RepID=UPI003FA3C658
MQAIGFKKSLAIKEEKSFEEFELPIPSPGSKDLLIKIKAIAVNPVDYKIRQNSAKDTELAEPKIIGWDAVGTVEAIGQDVELFKIGDEVFYAGDITRPGCNATYQVVDERIVAHKPTSLSATEAASMPLTSLTAWELLFDRMNITKEKDAGKTLLIIGGAGGVGSIATQIAKQVAGLKVVCTASRKETSDWCLKMGADAVANHLDLVSECEKAGFIAFDYIVDFVNLNHYWDDMVTLIKPQGHIGSITGSDKPIALNKLKNKSVSFSWEFMYTRPMFCTDDMIQQHRILKNIAELLDDKKIIPTTNTVLNGFTAENLKLAHEMLESGTAIGKIVISF